MNAWLLTWEGTTCDIRPDNKLVAIVSGRRGMSFVESLADVLYLRNYGTAHDMAFLSNRKRAKCYGSGMTRNGGRMIGNNPFIYLRLVSELQVDRDAKLQTETVTWKEPPSIRPVPERNYAIELVDPGECRSIVRPLRMTVANDLRCAPLPI